MSTGDQLLSNFDLYTEEQAPPTPELSHKLRTERSSSEGEPLGGSVSPPVLRFTSKLLFSEPSSRTTQVDSEHEQRLSLSCTRRPTERYSGDGDGAADGAGAEDEASVGASKAAASHFGQGDRRRRSSAYK